MALLLRGARVFARHGFDCEDCDEAMREYRGCEGECPVIDGKPFVLADVEGKGELRAANAVNLFSFANLGNVSDRYGFLWPSCPAWFARVPEVASCAEAIEVAKYIRAGDSAPVLAGRELTAGGRVLVTLALSALGWIESDALKEATSGD